MAVFTLCSASGAPGVTTSAFALARVWHLATAGRSALLVDAAPVGSALIPAFAGAGIPSGGGILAVAAVRVGQADGWFSQPAFWVVSGIILVALVVLSFFGPEEKKPEPEPEEEFDAFAGGYPVPPSKGQVLPELAGVLRPGPDDDAVVRVLGHGEGG